MRPISPYLVPGLGWRHLVSTEQACEATLSRRGIPGRLTHLPRPSAILCQRKGRCWADIDPNALKLALAR